jgi:hypothetical protein
MITRQNWANMDSNERLEALQDLEYNEAKAQGRAPTVLVSENMGANEMGEYNKELNQISINQDLLQADSLDQCLETYFHEERHAQQQHDADYPMIANDPVQAEEWAKNFENYVSPEENFAAYENQPVEADAREYASRRMEQFQAQEYEKPKSHDQTPEQRSSEEQPHSENYSAAYSH